MDAANVQRVADFKVDAKAAKTVVPDHLTNLPDETHIVTGTIVGNGALELASDKAKLSARVVKLVRNDGGGIDYQLAIFVSEPAPAPAPEPVAQLDPQVEEAVTYLVGKGSNEVTARAQVAKFGAARVLTVKSQELDRELNSIVAPPVPAQPKP